MQFSVGGIGLGGRREIFDGFGETFRAVVTHPKQNAHLTAARIGRECLGQRWGGGLEVSLLKFGEAEVELQSGQSRIEQIFLADRGHELRWESEFARTGTSVLILPVRRKIFCRI